MSVSDIQKIISEVVQGLIALISLAAVIFFQLNHLDVPGLIWLVLGSSLTVFGIKIGLPLQTSGNAAPTSEKVGNG